jgi:hypothetical protein
MLAEWRRWGRRRTTKGAVVSRAPRVRSSYERGDRKAALAWANSRLEHTVSAGALARGAIFDARPHLRTWTRARAPPRRRARRWRRRSRRRSCSTTGRGWAPPQGDRRHVPPPSGSSLGWHRRTATARSPRRPGRVCQTTARPRADRSAPRPRQSSRRARRRRRHPPARTAARHETPQPPDTNPEEQRLPASARHTTRHDRPPSLPGPPSDAWLCRREGAARFKPSRSNDGGPSSRWRGGRDWRGSRWADRHERKDNMACRVCVVFVARVIRPYPRQRRERRAHVVRDLVPAPRRRAGRPARRRRRRTPRGRHLRRARFEPRRRAVEVAAPRARRHPPAREP